MLLAFGWLAVCAGTGEAAEVIRAMTFNLRYASAPDGANSWSNSAQAPSRRRVVVMVLSNRAPDVVGFQEGEDGQLDYLSANMTGYALERQRPSGGGGSENAAFAWNTNKLDLLDRGAFSLGTAPGGGYWNNAPGTPFDPYAFFPGLALGFPRIALWGRFRWKATGMEFLFYTTHMDFNDEPQVRSAALICDDALARNDRMPASPLAIVVGDFNSSHLNRGWSLFTGSLATNGVTGDFKDSWYHLYESWFSSGTLHGFAGGTPAEDQRIDWILHRGGFTSVFAQVLYDAAVATNLADGVTRIQYPSDHYPVLAELLFPEPFMDTDYDGLPDAREFASLRSLPADADSDNDGLVDGQEDLNGNGVVDGGETDPAAFDANAQQPTDIRNHGMDGVRDYAAVSVASHGLDLLVRFDGRYLYVATQDAGEGNDHFIFVSTNPAEAVGAPWGKSGSVGRWLAYLADENDGTFCGWFDAAGALITNRFLARAATYHQNGGWLEGVLDLGSLLVPGFTQVLYLAAAPYGTADGGGLVSTDQAPSGNGDGNLLGVTEYAVFNPGDADHDGINDAADPDADGHGLPDAWEAASGVAGGASGDSDGDGASNLHELLAGTDPRSAASSFFVSPGGVGQVSWSVCHAKTATLWRTTGSHFMPDGPWQCLATQSAGGSFPSLQITTGISSASGYFRALQSP